MTDMLNVFGNIFQVQNLLMMVLGVSAGIIIGAIPGLTIIMAIVVLLPLTFGMDSVTGMYLLLGAFCGGSFGGSISAILLNTPGTAVAGATILDGYPMARKGRAADALKISLVGSTFGGIFSCVALLFFAPLIARLAFAFGPAEFFALTVFGLAMVSRVSGKSIIKGVIAACLGLGLSTIGTDQIEGIPRFAFGELNLYVGINLVVVMLGIFALSEMLLRSTEETGSGEKSIDIGKATLSIRDIFGHWKTMLVSSLIGLYVGAVPGAGGGIGAYMSYNAAKNMSKKPQEFGEGCVDGLLAPETGNNATTGSALIPMLTLGIPGSAPVAVLMGALTMQNIVPGPELFTKDSFWVYSIMLGLFLINIFLFIEGSLLTKIFVKINKAPIQALIPTILVLCMLGSYTLRSSVFDIKILLIFTVLGFIMKKFDFPIPSLTIGMVLGQLAESNFRRALVLSNGDYWIFLRRPLSAAFFGITFLALVFPLIKKMVKQR